MIITTTREVEWDNSKKWLKILIMTIEEVLFIPLKNRLNYCKMKMNS